MRAGDGDALGAVRCLERLEPRDAQDVAGEPHVLLVVVDDEDGDGGHRVTPPAGGKREAERAALAGALSTQSRPPWSSINFRASGRPSPVPSGAARAAPGLPELLEDHVLILGGDARPGVRDRDLRRRRRQQGENVDAAARRE